MIKIRINFFYDELARRSYHPKNKHRSQSNAQKKPIID